MHRYTTLTVHESGMHKPVRTVTNNILYPSVFCAKHWFLRANRIYLQKGLQKVHR